MDGNKLTFLDDNQSIASVITQIHNYFKDSHSSSKVKRSELLSRLEAVTEPTEEQALMEQLHAIDEQISLFGILSDSLSITDRVLHTRIVMDALGLDGEVYQPHYETEDEKAAEREAIRRNRTPQ